MVLCLLAFLVQGNDAQRSTEAWRFYQKSGTSLLDTTAYQAYLAQHQQLEQLGTVQRQIANGKTLDAVQTMEADGDFMQRLRHDQVITPTNADYHLWRANRTHYETLRGRVITERFSLNGNEPRVITLFTHMFLHADIMHLSGNMAVLFVVGYTVEAALGPLGFIALYLLGGLGAALPDLLMPAAGYHLSLGASGAISAVMAAYLVLFGRRRIDFFYWFIFFFGTARWPALAILPVWLANELLQKFVVDRGSHINYLAHFAGLLSGALLIAFYRWRRQGQSAPTVQQRDADQAIDLLRQRAEGYVAEMQFIPAARIYRKLLNEHTPDDHQVAQEYLRIARLARQPELVASAGRRLLKIASKQPKSIAPALLAELLGPNLGALPRFSATQWENLLGSLISGGQLDAAEKLLLRLFSHPDLRNAALRQAHRLADAFVAAKQIDRAAPLHRLLASQQPKPAAAKQ